MLMGAHYIAVVINEWHKREIVEGTIYYCSLVDTRGTVGTAASSVTRIPGSLYPDTTCTPTTPTYMLCTQPHIHRSVLRGRRGGVQRAFKTASSWPPYSINNLVAPLL